MSRQTAYIDIANLLLSEIATVTKVNRYKGEIDFPNLSEEMSGQIYIDFSNVDYREQKGNEQKAFVNAKFYILFANYATDHVTDIGSSDVLQEALEDWNFVDEVRNLLHGYSGNGFKQITITAESEIFTNTDLNVFVLEGLVQMC